MSKAYSRIELIDWVVRNRKGLPSSAHHLAIVLAQNYIDYNGRNRFKYWGEVRILFSDLMEMTGMSRKTVSRAAKNLADSGMWDYTPGRKGHMSIFTPTMNVSKTASLAPLADEGTAPVEMPTPQVFSTSPVPPASSAPTVPEDNPFGFPVGQPQGAPREAGTLLDEFQANPEAQEKAPSWEDLHDPATGKSIFPKGWWEKARNSRGDIIEGMNTIYPADQNKLIKSAAVLRAKGWNPVQSRGFLHNHQKPAAEITKGFVGYCLFLFKNYAAQENPSDYSRTPSAQKGVSA